MVNRKSILAVTAALACGGLTLSLFAAGLTLDQIPAKAREALQKLAGDSKIVEVESEKEGGIQVYEAEWLANGLESEAEVTAEGVLLEMEEGVRVEDVPEAVQAAAAQALPGAAKIHYEKHTVFFYEVEGRGADGKNKELVISPTGKVKGQEDEGEDDDADTDDDGDDDDDDDVAAGAPQ